MRITMKPSCYPCVLVAVLTSSATMAAAQDTTTAATQVAAALNAGHLNAFAAEDPNNPGRFVAALYVGGHILAMAGTYPDPSFLRQRIAAGDHKQAYIDLSSARNRQGRLFVEDYGAPGLRSTRGANEPFDITSHDGSRRTLYNGDWRAQKLSEAEYHQRFAADDREYRNMLFVLVAALKASASASTPIPQATTGSLTSTGQAPK